MQEGNVAHAQQQYALSAQQSVEPDQEQGCHVQGPNVKGSAPGAARRLPGD